MLREKNPYNDDSGLRAGVSIIMAAVWMYWLVPTLMVDLLDRHNKSLDKDGYKAVSASRMDFTVAADFSRLADKVYRQDHGVDNAWDCIKAAQAISEELQTRGRGTCFDEAGNEILSFPVVIPENANESYIPLLRVSGIEALPLVDKKSDPKVITIPEKRPAAPAARLS